MPLASIAHLILTYRYFVLIPLSIIEGPIVAFIAGTLASLGYFNIYLLCLIFLIRDLGMDMLYYAFGYYGWKTAFVKRLLKKIDIENAELDKARALWSKHPLRTIFLGKLSYAIAPTFVIAIGMIRIRLITFFKYSIWVTIVQFGTLLFLGYFFGNAFSEVASGVIQWIQFVALGASAMIVLYYFISWRLRKRFLHEHHNALN